MKKRVLIALMAFLLCISLAACGGSASAADFPTKPVTLIVPYGAGGTSDVNARIMSLYFPKYFNNQPLIVLNQPGGATTIGLNELVNSPADGYTIGWLSIPGITQPLINFTDYDYLEDLDHITQHNYKPQGLYAKTDSRFKTLQDVVDYAKENPGTLTYGHSSEGGPTHLMVEIFCDIAGIEMIAIPFDGTSAVITAFLGGHIDFGAGALGDIVGYIDSGEASMLVVAQDKREPGQYSEIPTFRELGYEVIMPMWDGISVPKGTPPEVQKILSEGMRNILTDPEFVAQMEELFVTPFWTTPEGFYNSMRAQTEVMRPILEALKIGARNQ